MKKILFIFFIANLLYTIILAFCHSPKDAGLLISIEGKIKNYSKYQKKYDSIKINIDDFVSAIPQITYRAKIDKNGNYNLKFKMDHPQDVYLQFGENLKTLFLRPGKKLVIDLDAEKFLLNPSTIPQEVFKIKGDDAKINYDLLKYNNKFLEFCKKWDEPNKIMTLSPEEYKSYRYNRMITELDFLKNW